MNIYRGEAAFEKLCTDNGLCLKIDSIKTSCVLFMESPNVCLIFLCCWVFRQGAVFMGQSLLLLWSHDQTVGFRWWCDVAPWCSAWHVGTRPLTLFIHSSLSFWKLAGGLILGVALWLRHDNQTSKLLMLQLGDQQAPSTFYISKQPLPALLPWQQLSVNYWRHLQRNFLTFFIQWYLSPWTH